MTNTPQRPHKTDDNIREAAVVSCRPNIEAWATSRDITLTDEDFACIVLAVMDMPDPFTAAKYVEPAIGHQVDYAFATVLDYIYRSLQSFEDDAVAEWVMKHKVRFPAKEGQGVRYLVGDKEYFGRVVGVVQRLASGYVNAIGSKPGSSASHTKIVSENILEVITISNTDTPTDTPPDGGTPVTMAAIA